MQWHHAGLFGRNWTKLADYAFFSVCDTIEGLMLACYALLLGTETSWDMSVFFDKSLREYNARMAKLLSKLIYSRVIAVSLLGRDQFPQVYWRIFRMFHSEEYRVSKKKLIHLIFKWITKVSVFFDSPCISSRHISKPN
jgi:hypothetical protein